MLKSIRICLPLASNRMMLSMSFFNCCISEHCPQTSFLLISSWVSHLVSKSLMTSVTTTKIFIYICKLKFYEVSYCCYLMPSNDPAHLVMKSPFHLFVSNHFPSSVYEWTLVIIINQGVSF